MKRVLVPLALLSTISCSSGTEQGGVAASDLGATSSLVLGSYNLEYFGSPTEGPADDALQVTNARTVIEHLDPDALAR